MRAKVVLTASVLAVVILAPAIYFHFKSDSPATPTPDAAPVVADANTPSAVPSILKRVSQDDHSQEGLPDPQAAPADLSPADHDTYVTERKAQLEELGSTDDPANLKIILSEMENSEPEIRQAALSASIQFGSPDAIPTLQHERDWATDPQEKVDIQKAIDFLQLPKFGSDSGAITQQSNDGSSASSN
jgi:hypothetical protein